MNMKKNVVVNTIITMKRNAVANTIMNTIMRKNVAVNPTTIMMRNATANTIMNTIMRKNVAANPITIMMRNAIADTIMNPIMKKSVVANIIMIRNAALMNITTNRAMSVHADITTMQKKNIAVVDTTMKAMIITAVAMITEQLKTVLIRIGMFPVWTQSNTNCSFLS